MGFLDALLGGRGKKLKAPAPDRLFAMTTALHHAGDRAGPEAPRRGRDRLPAARHRRLPVDPQGHPGAAARQRRGHGTDVETADDEFGYRWLILRDHDFEDLVVSLNTVSTELQGGGYGDRLLAAVFPFEEEGRPSTSSTTSSAARYYPFVPAPGEQAARHRARAAAQGPARRRAALRGGHVALVPALGDPALVVPASGWRRHGERRQPVLPGHRRRGGRRGARVAASPAPASWSPSWSSSSCSGS